VRETLALMEIDRRTLDVELRLQLAAQLPQIWGNRGQLQQALMNLLANALDSMAAVGDRPRLLTIRTAAQEPAAISIQVEHNGIGKSEGTGLRLAICRSIIDAHGGDLGMFADTPQGCTFRVVLPITSIPKIPKAGL